MRATLQAEISVVKLREILMGNVREWPNHRRITIVQREAMNPTIAIVLKSVLWVLQPRLHPLSAPAGISRR